ncbi:MAG: hypothetical protein P4L74_07325 [Candidatus Doudnabacteria bacterium]|nr:hypothetical protein [Candidatus Doudnabacteria bacterium]
MPSTLLQSESSLEGHRESAQMPEAQSPEISDHDEASLRRMVDQATAEISSVQARIDAISEDRLQKASSGLAPERAGRIFSTGGFADRISKVKKEISDLINRTKSQIGVLLKPSSEIETRQSKNEPDSDSEHKAASPQSLEHYMEANKLGGMETVKEKARLAQLRLQRIKNPEKVLALAHYLEQFSVNTEFKNLKISKNERKKIEEEEGKLKKQGFNIRGRYTDDEEEDKVKLWATKESPYSFNTHDSKFLAKDLAEMVSSPNDPVRMFESLRNLGYHLEIIKNWTFHDNDKLKEFFKNPGALAFLEKVKTFGGEGLKKDLFKGYDPILRLSELATKDSAEHIFTPESEKNLEKVSAILGKPVEFADVEDWIELSRGDTLMEIFSTLKKMPGSDISTSDWLNKLHIIKERGVENEVVELLKKGFSERMLGKFYGYGPVEGEKATESLKQALEVFKSNPQLQKFVLGAAKIFGIEDPLGKENLEKFCKLEEQVPEAGLAFEFLLGIGLKGQPYELREFFGEPEIFFRNRKLFQRMEQPQVRQVITLLAESGHELKMDTLSADFYKVDIIIAGGLTEAVARCKDFPGMADFIIGHAELIKDITKKELAEYLNQILSGSESKSIRDRQMVRGEMMGTVLSQGRYDVLAKVLSAKGELTPEHTEIAERVEKFVDTYKIGNKGRTIVTLLAMREYREGENLGGLLERIGKTLVGYQKLLEQKSAHHIPAGLRASIGMEYEITNSTAQAYLNSNKNFLENDMQDVSRFAGVGKGKDAVFEIATKSTDNPYAMLLELQLLQDLEFIDFNFRREGYEKGSRGCHITVGGEHGLKTNNNANFLQNTLMMSGWGGINAGRKVEQLSKARNANIRQRDTYSTQKVFENCRPAVEFRSLSLDTWEPFERTVETSYYGAIAVQAMDKYLSGLKPAVFFQNFETQFPRGAEGLVSMLKDAGMVSPDLKDEKTKQIIFLWMKLQAGVYGALQDHNENFLNNETGGYFDEDGKWIDPNDFGGNTNKERFLAVSGGEQGLQSYSESVKISPADLFETATEGLANRCTAITNLFIKPSLESGGDVTNATASFDTTKIGRTIESSDTRAKYQSVFEAKGQTREGYYYIQGGSQKMLLHRIQIELLEFNKAMQKIIE